jgi:ActR/RegA family two-component response regulator
LEWNEEMTASGIIDDDTAYNSVLKLPLAGYRGVSGELIGEGVHGIYWQSTVNGAYVEIDTDLMTDHGPYLFPWPRSMGSLYAVLKIKVFLRWLRKQYFL